MVTNSLKRVKLPHGVIVRAPGLLPMLYKPSELAEELGISSRAIREWTRKGLPHQRDGRGHLWINGVEFVRWVESERSLGTGQAMDKDEAYCLRCRRPVKLVEPTRQVDGKKVLLQAECPRCGARINKGVSYGEPS